MKPGSHMLVTSASRQILIRWLTRNLETFTNQGLRVTAAETITRHKAQINMTSHCEPEHRGWERGLQEENTIMSGGSFNYMYGKETFDAALLREMADALNDRGMGDAADATLALIQEPSRELRALWMAVEWCVSGDYGEDQVNQKYETYKGITKGEQQ